jgi:hypothetical protein
MTSQSCDTFSHENWRSPRASANLPKVYRPIAVPRGASVGRKLFSMANVDKAGMTALLVIRNIKPIRNSVHAFPL